MTSRATPRAMPRAILGAFALDIVLVVAFAALGRASHDSAPFGIGLAQTAWPFLAGLVLGWIVTLAWRHPISVVPAGLGIWALTVAGGMLLRTMTDQGTALPFVIVATLTLLLLLVGWRVIALLVARARRRRTPVA